MSKKIFITLFSILLLSAGCNPFSKPLVAGTVKSVNGGADWQFANTMKTGQTATIAALNVSKMAFDPNNREIVYAGGYNGGLYKSADSGATWERILSKILVFDFAVDPSDSKTVYVAGGFGTSGKVLVTKDNGGTWQEIYNEASENNTVRAIAINPGNTNQIAIGTESGNVIKSSDGGLSWQLVKDFGDQVKRILWQNNQLYVLVRTRGLYKSSDFGQNFINLTESFNKNISVGSYTYNTGIEQSFNQFYVDTISSGLIYLTSGSGLYKTLDEGQTWQKIVLPVKTSENSTWAIAVAKTSSNIVFTSVGGTIFKSLDAGQTWQTQAIVSSGFMNYILVDPVLPQIVYAGIYGGTN